MYSKTKKLTTISMLCAFAYILTLIGRIPIILFLKYDSKDIVITIGGFIFGPMVSFYITLLVSIVQMFTTSSTGIWGCVMNLISSCAFACTAAFVYKRRHTLSGAVMGLCCGWSSMVIVMLLWNYIIAPVYMGYPREEITGLLFTAFLPFNLIKGGLNAGGTMLLYKPVVTALRRSHLLEPTKNTEKARPDKGVILASLLIIITCILFVLSFNKVL